jgi:hypothetical protein
VVARVIYSNCASVHIMCYGYHDQLMLELYDDMLVVTVIIANAILVSFTMFLSRV